MFLLIRNWITRFSIVAFGQIIVQALALITGIIIIRLLPVKEYALYVIANTLLGTMTNLADGGISSGVMSEASKVWQDKERLGKVLATGLYLRKRFAFISIFIGIPILIYLLYHNGASWVTIVLIVAGLIPSYYAALSDSLLEIIPKIHQDIKSLQINQIIVGLGRLILSSSTLFIMPVSFIAIMANGVPRIFGNINLRKISLKFLLPTNIPDLEVKDKILSVVAKIMPGTIYGCVVGQLTVFILSLLGKTNFIGQIGALSRISMMLTVFTSVSSVLIIPRFARLPNNFKILLKKYPQILGLYILIGLFLVLIVLWVPQIFLFILGNRYSGLKKELLFCVITNYLNVIYGASYSLANSRAWIINPWVGIPIGLLSIVIGLSIFNFSTVIDVFKYNIFLDVVGLSTSLFICFKKIFKLRVIENETSKT